MNVEINLLRGKVPTMSWDDEFRKRFEAHMEAHPEDGNPSDRNGFYRMFMDAQRGVIAGVEKILGEDAEEPFTITIKVKGKRDKPRRKGGVVLY